MTKEEELAEWRREVWPLGDPENTKLRPIREGNQMSKKTIDIEKVREAIKVLEEARELSDEIDKILPRKAEPIWRYYPMPWYPCPTRWQIAQPNDCTITWGNATGAVTCSDSYTGSPNPVTYINN